MSHVGPSQLRRASARDVIWGCLTSLRRGADFAGEAGGDEWLFPVEHELRARDAGFPLDADAP
jgi:hypothetical protein